MKTESRHVRVAIIGSGFAGLGTAIRLKNKGIDDFVILERADDLGGVWRDNSYPNCACDVQSHLYSFSFARNTEWTRSFSPQPEIWNYLRACAQRFGLLSHLALGHEVRALDWDEKKKIWKIETSKENFTADLVVAATGGLSEPSIPKLPGLDSFEGTTFHSSTWRHDFDLTNQRVAVIGTGASAIQFVPGIQPKVKKLFLIQRTPPWIMPRNDRAISDLTKSLLRKSKFAQLMIRGGIYGARELLALPFFYPTIAKIVQMQARHHLHSQVKDPVLRQKLTPSYTLGCKRILLSDDYLPSLTKPNVEVIAAAVTEIRPHSIVTADGGEHEVDAIIFGTGFQVQDYPLAKKTHGRNGELLAARWKSRMTAHLGTTVHGFPNLFFLMGPNTALGHSSVILMIESQIEYFLSALEYLEKNRLNAIEPNEDAQKHFVDEIDAKTAGTVWASGGCASWYLDKTQKNTTLWPGFTFSFMRRMSRFNESEYRVA
jgi:cation diffusion facilitator CzcD-associated flavoprotein CzcO